MPSGDRTGPEGMGPRTGRAFGYCSGFDTPGYHKGAGGGFGRSMGRGRGIGRGMGRGRGFHAGWGFGYPTPQPGGQWPYATEMTREDEIRMLKSQMDSLERSRKVIEKRLGELGKE
jgi:hypothetical protein